MSLLEKLGIIYPIIQAPMAGGATTPELVAAVSNFGGMGSLGAGMTAPATLNDQINAIKKLTDRPFMVNLMVLSDYDASTFDTEVPEWLTHYYLKHKIEATFPNKPAQNFTEQLQVLYDNPVPVVSFTFGIISPEQVQRLHQLGICVIGTANHPLEAQAWAEIGADAVSLQGLEAGGHRGGWLIESEAHPLELLTLISQTRTITDIPLVASGGIMTGQDIRSIQMAGAQIAQLGTAFLTTDESGINVTYKRALLDVSLRKRSAETRLTRLFSGKLARGLTNKYLLDFAEFDNKSELPPYPQLNAMTGPMRLAAANNKDAEHLSLWAGKGVSQVRKERAITLLERLVQAL